ncbi:MAG: substrate-binding domain-containing protein [Candidatus Sulfotelmatobacter sp.]
MRGERFRSWVVFAFLICLVAIMAACSKPAQVGKHYTVAVIPMGSTHEYWKSFHAGAVKAVQDLAGQGTKVDIIWKAPLREQDREEQTRIVEGFISQRVDGIVLAPSDGHALVRPVEEAASAGIPTVVVDSALDTTKIVSFVASDNYQGGVLAADQIGELLNGKGKVVLLRYQEGVASTHDREEGFVQKIKSYPEIELVSSNQFSGPTRETSRRASENLLTRYAGQIQAVFTPNEASTAGMLLALQDIKRAGNLVLIGFDMSETFITAMRNNQLQGIVVQNPFRMGDLGVKAMIDHLEARNVKARVDTGVMLVTPGNMETPEAQQLLHPPLQEYLNQ